MPELFVDAVPPVTLPPEDGTNVTDTFGTGLLLASLTRTEGSVVTALPGGGGLTISRIDRDARGGPASTVTIALSETVTLPLSVAVIVCAPVTVELNVAVASPFASVGAPG